MDKIRVYSRKSVEELVEIGLLKVGENTVVDEDIFLCHPTKSGEQKPVVLGNNCYIRSGSVIYSGVRLGDNSQTGHHVVIRENTQIGNFSSIGTGVKCEMDTKIGNHVSIETQSHITGKMVIEDYVFVGGFVGTTNDNRMLWRREGHGKFLKGPHLKFGCRIGSGVILLPAVVIGRESMIGAGAVVTKDIPDFAIAMGVPARIRGEVPENERLKIQQKR